MSGARLDVVVLDACERAALVCARSLGRAGLRVGAFDQRPAPAFRSRWVCVHGLLPSYIDAPEAYVDAVLEVVRRHRPRVVVPVHDGSIETLRPRRAEIESGSRLALAPEPGLGAALDKTLTLARAAALGIRVPDGAIAETPAAAAALATRLGLPVVVKPVQSWTPGARGRATSRLAVTAAEAAEALEQAGRPALVQRWVSGRREAVWLLASGDEIRARFAQVAHRTCPRLGGSSVLRESIEPPGDVLTAAERLVLDLGVTGFSEVEFRRDADGTPLLMEINPRLTASLELGVRAGIDFPRLIFDWTDGTVLPEPRGYRVGLRMRWLGGDVRWLRESLAQGPGPDGESRRRALWRFATDFARPAGYDYVAVTDPRPAIAASSDFVRRGLRVRRRSDPYPPTTQLEAPA